MAKSEMPASFEHHTHRYDASLKSASDSAEMLCTYSNAIHGFSTQFSLFFPRSSTSSTPEAKTAMEPTPPPPRLGLSSPEVAYSGTRRKLLRELRREGFGGAFEEGVGEAVRGLGVGEERDKREKRRKRRREKAAERQHHQTATVNPTQEEREERQRERRKT